MPDSLIDLAGLHVGAEEFFGAVLGTTEQPIWVVDRDGVIRFANPAAIATLGYERADELAGRHSHATIHHRHEDGTPFPTSECQMLRPLASGETVACELDWFIRRDGSMFPVSYVSVPIQMDGGRGAVVVFNDIEDRLRAERSLREHEARLAAQQASLRRVAMLVAGGAASSAEVFAAVAREVGDVIGLPLVVVWRYEPGGTATVLGAWSDRPHPFQVGTNWPLDGPTICARVLQTGRPARIDDFAELPGTIAGAARGAAISACAGAPIVVDGGIWGAMSTDATDGAPLPAGVEDRLAEFTELIAATFSTAARQDQLARLAEEQAALRRVAVLVAQGVPVGELFRAVTEELGRLVGADEARVIRHEGDGFLRVVATWSPDGQRDVAGERWPLAGDKLGSRASVGSPIVLEGRVWGTVVVHFTESHPLWAETEERVTAFAELVATAIMNAEARAEVSRLADEQAALRRVATLVARESPATEVFAAVAEEIGRLLRVDDTRLIRYEDDGTVTVVASWGKLAEAVPVGTHLTLEGTSVCALVFRTQRPARMDDYAKADGPVGEFMRGKGIRSAVGTPIIVQGRVWGAMMVGSLQDDPLPADTEARVGQFAQLIGTAIGNIQTRSDLAASRARLVEATDEERRRLVRDLHDGAQQRLVHTIVTLKLASRALERGEAQAGALVSEALDQTERATAEVRELAHGILPAALTRGGLRAGVDALAARMSVPVETDVSVGRLPPAVEATAYYVVAEALTNVAKHARATQAAVTARIENGSLHVHVRDDGVGGAQPEGSGLVGLGDRLAVLDGRLRVESPPDRGTLVAAAIPLADPPS